MREKIDRSIIMQNFHLLIFLFTLFSINIPQKILYRTFHHIRRFALQAIGQLTEVQGSHAGRHCEILIARLGRRSITGQMSARRQLGKHRRQQRGDGSGVMVGLLLLLPIRHQHLRGFGARQGDHRRGAEGWIRRGTGLLTRGREEGATGRHCRSGPPS